MKPFSILLCLILTLFAELPSSAAGVDDGPGIVTEKFYAGYVAEVDANRDTKVWVAKSKLVTDKFRKAYAKIMNSEEVDADPVLNAQDIPSAPFKTETAIIKEDTATVVVASSFGGDKHRLKLKLVKVNGVWLLDGLPE
ncbi:DUF3828 domain-containing protein [Luteolibacter sp. SL250]|uniref:DUF3828 domain-containing protein n=1 Tax=Luteolibacter sp. SL250 TaxID=2995170 RepID=UPI00226F7F21|nr:DUF3828 domain-containing protein [Luteolibacter sp. SL250]WAC17815.1 DUF3828 domain-containing protein [Luteolibacter sp. SL250]